MTNRNVRTIQNDDNTTTTITTDGEKGKQWTQIEIVGGDKYSPVVLGSIFYRHTASGLDQAAEMLGDKLSAFKASEKGHRYAQLEPGRYASAKLYVRGPIVPRMVRTFTTIGEAFNASLEAAPERPAVDTHLAGIPDTNPEVFPEDSPVETAARPQGDCETDAKAVWYRPGVGASDLQAICELAGLAHGKARKIDYAVRLFAADVNPADYFEAPVETVAAPVETVAAPVGTVVAASESTDLEDAIFLLCNGGTPDFVGQTYGAPVLLAAMRSGRVLVG